MEREMLKGHLDMIVLAALSAGPAHGYAGNVHAFANRQPVELADLEPYVLRENGLANWLPDVGSRPDEVRVQWCHGSPWSSACTIPTKPCTGPRIWLGGAP